MTTQTMNSPEVVVAARGLRCRYGAHVAVDGIDLEVRRGELVALLGTNGAGKITTVETLEGHRRPDQGKVEVLGRDPARHRRALAGQVGVMLQKSGFAGELTAVETLHTWQRLHPDHPGPADPLFEVGLGPPAAGAGRPAVRWRTAPARPGAGAGHRPAGAVPGRTDHRP